MTADKPKSKKPATAAQKFLFDVRSFDDDFVEEEEEEIPPPPTFSEEELAAARDEAFAQGKQAGLDEAAASRDTEIAALIGTMTQDFATLFSAEKAREERYEAEAVFLARAVFNRLFPTLNEHSALDEIEAVIKDAFALQQDTPEILVEVHPDDESALQDKLSALIESGEYAGTYSIKGNAQLGKGDCRLSWKEGGGRRDVSGLQQQIELYFEQTLAGKPQLVNNREDEEITEEPVTDPSDDPEGSAEGDEA